MTLSAAAHHAATTLHTLTGSAIDTGLGNAETLLFKVGGVVLFVLGLGIMWASKKGKFGLILGQVGIIGIGVFVMLLGVGGMTAGTELGRDILAFVGLA